METAGAEDIPEDAERKGLGTPATRAGTIEKLVQKGFMERKGDKKTRYNATLLLTTEENGRANFHLEFENSRSGTRGGGEK